MAEHLTNEEILQIIKNYKDELQKLKVDANVVIGGIGIVENFIDSIETNRKTGHWVIEEEDNLKRIFQCTCSICNKDAHGYWWIYGLPKYCPNCGAIMTTDKKDWLNKDVKDWETFETNVCYDSVGYDAEISFVEKCIGRKLTCIEKYLLMKAIRKKWYVPANNTN